MMSFPLIRIGSAVLCLSLAGAVSAAGNESSSVSVAPPAIGDATRAALAIQRNGSQGGEAILLRGEEASLAHKRYLDSFTHPIPPYFSSSASGKSSTASGSNTSK